MPCMLVGCEGKEISGEILLCKKCWGSIPKGEREYFPSVSAHAKELMLQRFMYNYLGCDFMDRFKELPMCECCEEEEVEAVGFKWCRPCIELYKKVNKCKK